MGLSRRQFTKEFKLAAVRRLEEGVSLREVARALEVNPMCCTVGGVSFDRGQVRLSRQRTAALERRPDGRVGT